MLVSGMRWMDLFTMRGRDATAVRCSYDRLNARIPARALLGERLGVRFLGDNLQSVETTSISTKWLLHSNQHTLKIVHPKRRAQNDQYSTRDLESKVIQQRIRIWLFELCRLAFLLVHRRCGCGLFLRLDLRQQLCCLRFSRCFVVGW